MKFQNSTLVIADHINSSVTAMLATAQEMCPNVLQHDSKSLQDLTSVCDNKSRIPNDFVKHLGKQTRFHTILLYDYLTII